MLRPPLCLQQQLLPPASPSLQQLPPIRFGPFNGFLSRVQILRTGRGLDPVRGRAPSRPARRRLGRRGSVSVSVSVPGIQRDPPAAAGWAPARPARRDGRLAGRRLASKNTPPPRPQSTGCESPGCERPAALLLSVSSRNTTLSILPGGILACPLWAGKRKWKHKVAFPTTKLDSKNYRKIPEQPKNQKLGVRL